MAFPPQLMLRLSHLYLVTSSSSVLTGSTTRRWGWYLGRRGYIIPQGASRHFPLDPELMQLVGNIVTCVCILHRRCVILNAQTLNSQTLFTDAVWGYISGTDCSKTAAFGSTGLQTVIYFEARLNFVNVHLQCRSQSYYIIVCHTVSKIIQQDLAVRYFNVFLIARCCVLHVKCVPQPV
jgi:hypothetical protein